MSESIYGNCKNTLPEVMDVLVRRIEHLNQIHKEETGEGIYEHFIYRIKSEESMREKCRRKNLPETCETALGHMHDAIGLRIVCSFVDDIYRIVDYIREQKDITVFNEKDYVKNPKENGYRSYHMIIQLQVPYEDWKGNDPGLYFAEIQLRTIAMDSWAALEHQVKYKKDLGKTDLKLITEELKRCADELASCDLSMQTIRNLIQEEQK